MFYRLVYNPRAEQQACSFAGKRRDCLRGVEQQTHLRRNAVWQPCSVDGYLPCEIRPGAPKMCKAEPVSASDANSNGLPPQATARRTRVRSLPLISVRPSPNRCAYLLSARLKLRRVAAIACFMCTDEALQHLLQAVPALEFLAISTEN
jgi:hypothetical protein